MAGGDHAGELFPDPLRVTIDTPSADRISWLEVLVSLLTRFWSNPEASTSQLVVRDRDGNLLHRIDMRSRSTAMRARRRILREAKRMSEADLYFATNSGRWTEIAEASDRSYPEMIDSWFRRQR